MADNEEIKTVFNLDIADSLENLAKVGEALGKAFDTEKLAGFVAGAKSTVEVLVAITAAYEGVKIAMQTVFEAENIKAVNHEFETLTKNAGIATDALKEGLASASGGLVDDNELLKAANRSLIEMGGSAQKLPQIMELARKATSVFGGDLVQNFESINQAIATGNTRQLRNLGIIIDVKKATQDYATSLGIAENSLSKVGQQEALMNAVLAQGGKAFSGVDADTKEAQNTFKSIVVDITEVKDVFVLAFDKVMGPLVRGFLKDVKAMSSGFSEFVKIHFGSAEVSATASIKSIENSIKEYSEKLEHAKQIQAGVFGKDIIPDVTQREITKFTNKIKEYESELVKLKTKAGELGAGRGPAGGGASDEKVKSQVQENSILLKNEAEFQKEMTALRKESITTEMNLITDVKQVDAITAEQRVLINQEAEAKIKAVHAATHLDSQQKAAEIVQIEKNKANQLAAVDLDLNKKKLKALQNYKDTSKNTTEGLTRGFEASAKQDQINLEDFGKTGERVYGSFKSNAVDAFTKVGQGSMSVGEAMKATIFGVVGDEAIARGTVMMMSGVWPPNPIALAGGAALVAFGGFLKGQAGGAGGKTSAPAASGGGGASSSADVTSSASDASQQAAEQNQKVVDKLDQVHQDIIASTPAPDVAQSAAATKSVQIQIAGHFFETEQTRTRLLQMVREATDATDFKYVQIGQT